MVDAPAGGNAQRALGRGDDAVEPRLMRQRIRHGAVGGIGGIARPEHADRRAPAQRDRTWQHGEAGGLDQRDAAHGRIGAQMGKGPPAVRVGRQLIGRELALRQADRGERESREDADRHRARLPLRQPRTGQCDDLAPAKRGQDHQHGKGEEDEPIFLVRDQAVDHQGHRRRGEQSGRLPPAVQDADHRRHHPPRPHFHEPRDIGQRREGAVARGNVVDDILFEIAQDPGERHQPARAVDDRAGIGDRERSREQHRPALAVEQVAPPFHQHQHRRSGRVMRPGERGEGEQGARRGDAARPGMPCGQQRGGGQEGRDRDRLRQRFGGEEDDFEPGRRDDAGKHPGGRAMSSPDIPRRPDDAERCRRGGKAGQDHRQQAVGIDRLADSQRDG